MESKTDWIVRQCDNPNIIGTISNDDYRNICKSVFSNKQLWIKQLINLGKQYAKAFIHSLLFLPVIIIFSTLLFWFFMPEFSLFIMKRIPLSTTSELKSLSLQLIEILILLNGTLAATFFVYSKKIKINDFFEDEKKRQVLTKIFDEYRHVDLSKVVIYKEYQHK